MHDETRDADASQVPSDRPGESAGDVIDRYTLVEPVGEGGMGTVWLAEQSEPVKRRVALKIIKLGMDTREVVVRFEAERQALALMDHPCIAKVLDGGATETGRPYFVMELVDGVPITQFCDDQRLDVRARLELFARVCEAVQHAHHKGVIHRDIKPSNVLVSVGDDGPTPKVIDFGIAKATSAELTEATLATEVGQIVGTPEYMAPEQAGAGGLDIDTRADVYSLGVLLYELLTGTKTFDAREALQSGYDELLRQIREVDPALPSTRVSSLGDTATTIADCRLVDASTLSQRLRGELDWVVMRAIEKDRSRRYDTPSALAEDVERYLANEPVEAAPPSAAYRARTFVRRNRAAVAAAATLAVVLVLGLAGTIWGLVWALDETKRADLEASQKQIALAAAEEQRDAAERELARATEFKRVVAGLFFGVRPLVALDKDTELLEMLLRSTSDTLLAGEVEDEAVARELHELLGTTYNVLSIYDRAESHLVLARDIAERTFESDALELAWARLNWAQLLSATGEQDDAIALYETILADLPAPVPGPGTEPIHLTLRADFAFSLILGEEYDAAERQLEEYFELADAGALTTFDEHYDAFVRLAMVYSSTGRDAAAVELYEEFLEPMGEELGELSPLRGLALGAISEAYGNLGDVVRAEALLREQLGVFERTSAPEAAAYMGARRSFARFLLKNGRPQEAVEQLEALPALSEATRGADHPDHVRLLYTLGRALALVGRYDEAERNLRTALDGYVRIDGPWAPHTLSVRLILAFTLYDAGGNDEEALAMLLELEPHLEREQGPNASNTIDARLTLADLLSSVGRDDEAIAINLEGLAGRRALLGDDHPDTINALSVIAGRCLMADRFDEAIAFFEEARERGLRVLGPEDRDVLGMTTNLAICFNILDRPEEAVALLEPNAEIKLRVLGIGDPWTANCFSQLASAHALAGRIDEANAVGLRMLELQSDFVLEHSDDWRQLDEFAEVFLDPQSVVEFDAERSTVLAERAIELSGGDRAEPHATLARARFEAGDVAGAVAAAELALEHAARRPRSLRTKIEAQLEVYRAARADE